MRFRFLTLTLLSAVLCSGQYAPPQPKVEPLYPTGLRVSIPDEPGIIMMAFHAKINEKLNGLEVGTIARDIAKARNGRWTFEDRSIELRPGDTIYYWTFVIHDRIGYKLVDQKHRVTDFYNYDGSLATSAESPAAHSMRLDDNVGSSDCKRSATIVNGKNPCIGELLFVDHFNELDTNRWRRVEQFSGSPDFEFVVYKANDENVKVRDGQLKLTPTLLEKKYDRQFVRDGNLVLGKCTGQLGTRECKQQGWSYQILPPVITGRVDTKESFSFTYGRVEIRAKVPRGNWIYPLITLEPLKNVYGPGYESGQLRIASVVGNEVLVSVTGEDVSGRSLWAGAVFSEKEYIRRDSMSRRISGRHWSYDYHIYELEWTQNRIMVRVDGVEYGNKVLPSAGYGSDVLGEYVDRWVGDNAPFNEPFFLSFGVAVGGSVEFPDNCTSNGYNKPWKNRSIKAQLRFWGASDDWSKTWKDDDYSLKVDYVKVWAL